MPNMARDIMYKCNSVYHRVACSKLKTTLVIYEVPNITQTNLSHKYQLSAISVHSVCSFVGSIYKKQILYFCKGVSNILALVKGQE